MQIKIDNKYKIEQAIEQNRRKVRKTEASHLGGRLLGNLVVRITLKWNRFESHTPPPPSPHSLSDKGQITGDFTSSTKLVDNFPFIPVDFR